MEQKINTQIIGDGKMPNKYWVSISNDYLYYNQQGDVYDWISDLNLFEAKSKTLRQFTTYKEAYDFSFELGQGDELDGIRINTVTIEDRLSGEIYCRTYHFLPEKGMIAEDSFEDTGFTSKTMSMKYGKVMV